VLRTGRSGEVVVRQEAACVIVIFEGKAAVMPWEAADELARAITQKARQAEEVAKAEHIALDQALLLRAGATIGLSNNRWIRRLAGIEAAHNPMLRRFMPGGVKSQEMFGTPTVRKGNPR
jgi:predicted ATPase